MSDTLCLLDYDLVDGLDMNEFDRGLQFVSNSP